MIDIKKLQDLPDRIEFAMSDEVELSDWRQVPLQELLDELEAARAEIDKLRGFVRAYDQSVLPLADMSLDIARAKLGDV